jgi:hypothetical protein
MTTFRTELPAGSVVKATEDYDLVIHEVKSEFEVSGLTRCYAIKNRSSGVLEGTGRELCSMIAGTDAFQAALDDVRTGTHTRGGIPPSGIPGLRAN